MRKRLEIVALMAGLLMFTGCYGDYSKSDGMVYYHSMHTLMPVPYKFVVQDADAGTFTDLGDKVGKDKNHVYLAGYILPGADAATFVNLGHGYASDINGFYHITESGLDAVAGAQRESFETLSDEYARDGNAVYHKHERLAHVADPGSFEIVSRHRNHDWCRDKYNYYYDTIRVDVDRASFKILKRGYSKDANGVYYTVYNKGLFTVKGADPRTFRVITRKISAEGVGRDCSGYFLGTGKITREQFDDIHTEPLHSRILGMLWDSAFGE